MNVEDFYPQNESFYSFNNPSFKPNFPFKITKAVNTVLIILDLYFKFVDFNVNQKTIKNNLNDTIET